MRRVFADTYYWMALLSTKDEGHEQAMAVSESLVDAELVTTDEVLSEVLTFFGRHGAGARQAAVALIEMIIVDHSITLLPQTHDSFLAGLRLYKARPDKGYSLIDCIVMSTMRDQNISDVLIRDAHFLQEGFNTLL